MSEYKALLDRPLNLGCWRGALAVDGDWLTDGRICLSLCHVIGPYIDRAEALGQDKAQDDRIRGQEEVDRLMDAVETTDMLPAKELGWRRVPVELAGKERRVIEAFYVEAKGIRYAFLADYVRLLKSFVDYDEVRVPSHRTRPAGFYRRGELVAGCTQLSLP